MLATCLKTSNSRLSSKIAAKWTASSKSPLELQSQKLTTRTFDNVIVATGHYTTPNIPDFKGLGLLRKTKVLHSHDFKVPTGYKGQNVVVVGGSYSAEDLASMCWKFDAKNITILSRNPFSPYG